MRDALPECAPPAGPAPVPVAARHILACNIGNALEFYDFLIYSYFAIQIGHAYFPSTDPFSSLMMSLATFGAGFATRPLGGLVIGAYADRAGRRPAMLLSLFLMGVAILAIALIPPYAAIGLAAPILAIAARLVQGFALGGEVGPNTAFLLEAGSPARRGYRVAWQIATQRIAAATGAAVGLLLSVLLSRAALDAYGWRLAFLLGGLALPIGLWLRRTLPETLRSADAAPEPGAANRVRFGLLLIGIVAFGGFTIRVYLFDYLTTFAQASLHLSAGIGFAASLAGSLVGIAAALASGWLSDRLGRRPVLLWGNAVFLLLILPVFALMTRAPGLFSLAIGMVLLQGAGMMSMTCFQAALCEALPANVRGRAFGTVYALAIALFGGSAQPVVTWLVHASDSTMAPAWYLLAATAATLAVLTRMPETAPVRLGANAG